MAPFLYHGLWFSWHGAKQSICFPGNIKQNLGMSSLVLITILLIVLAPGSISLMKTIKCSNTIWRAMILCMYILAFIIVMLSWMLPRPAINFVCWQQNFTKFIAAAIASSNIIGSTEMDTSLYPSCPSFFTLSLHMKQHVKVAAILTTYPFDLLNIPAIIKDTNYKATLKSKVLHLNFNFQPLVTASGFSVVQCWNAPIVCIRVVTCQTCHIHVISYVLHMCHTCVHTFFVLNK